MVQTLKKIYLISALALSLLFVQLVAMPAASDAFDPRDCPDPKEQWHKCYQKLTDVNRYINAWCSNADPDKREVCRVTLFDSIDYTPSYIQSNPDGCDEPGTAVKMQNSCWVTIKDSSDWFDYLDRYSQDCTFTEPTEDCSVIEEFLEDNQWNDDGQGSTGLPGDINQSDPADTKFMKRITAYFRWLIVGIGIIGVFSLVIAGIQYAAAQDNAQSVADAKGRMVNVVIGVAIYFVMFAALQWLIPGGLF